MEITENNVKPRVLKASWTVESKEDLLDSFGFASKDKPLCSKYKGKKKTVKQRNKFMTSFFIGKINKSILNNRQRIKTEKAIINSMAEEIRREIDREILEQFMRPLTPGN